MRRHFQERATLFSIIMVISSAEDQPMQLGGHCMTVLSEVLHVIGALPSCTRTFDSMTCNAYALRCALHRWPSCQAL